MFTIAGAKVGVTICEDLWYAEGAAQSLGLAGADVVLNLSGSPYHHGKRHFRQRMFGTRAADNAVIVAHCNLVGGQDELVFDGNSMVFDHEGELIAHAPAFEEHLLVIDLDLESLRLGRLHVPLRRYPGLQQYARPVDEVFVSDAPTGDKPAIPPATNVERLDHEAELYKALVTGTRDYVHKNGFETVIVGISGGIDSSLVATIATDALGPEHVVGVSNPSRYSSEGSIADARALADNLGIKLMIIPIEDGTRRLPRHAGRTPSAAPSPAPRRRTSSPASAATSGWRSRTSSAGSPSSPAATRARWPPATPRSTATWPAVSP